MERETKFNVGRQVFIGIANQHGAAVGINNGQQWANQFFQQIIADLKILDGVDKIFVAIDEKNTNNRTEPVLLSMENTLGQYAGPNTQLKQHVKAAIQALDAFNNNMKATRPINVMPAANRNAAIEKFITAIKVLKTSLDAVAKDCDAWLVKTRSQVAGYRGTLTITEQLHRNFGTNLKACVARALAAAQKMKAHPDQPTYDREMDKGARDLHATLVVANKTNNWQAWHVPNPAPHLQALLPFAGGNKRTVPNNTPEATIRQWVSEFNTMVKAIQQAYGA